MVLSSFRRLSSRFQASLGHQTRKDLLHELLHHKSKVSIVLERPVDAYPLQRRPREVGGAQTYPVHTVV